MVQQLKPPLTAVVCWILLVSIGTASAFPQHHREKRVVKGKSTKIEEIPYQVALVNDNFPVCGGTIIADNVIMTAAHCCCDTCSYQSNETFVYPGMFSKKDMPKLRGYKIKDVIIHEDYNFTGEATPDDIALLVLEEKLTFGPTTRKIKLVEEPYGIPLTATVSGWGSTNCNFSLSNDDACNGWYATELQSGVLTITRRENKLIYAPNTTIAGNYGDSGGPIVANGELIGISRNCDIVKPGIFDFDGTSVLDYLPWIRKALQSIE